MKERLAGKVAFITGTGGGQGRSAAILFAQEGAKIVGCDLKKEGGEETAHMIAKAGGESIFRTVDLADGDQVKNWFEWGLEHYSTMDILYNNASGTAYAPVEEMTWEQWHFTVRNELDLIYWACHLAWPYLKEAAPRSPGGASIINTASGSGMVGIPAIGFLAHAATKGGVIALTRQLAAEGGPLHIRANSISPGLIETPATENLLRNPEFRMGFTRGVPLGRLGTPEDIANMALFLASDEAAYVTGANIPVDGGMTAV